MAFNLGAFGQGFASGMNAGANLMMTRERLKDAKEARAERERTRAEEKGWLDNFNSTAGGIYKDFGGDAAGAGDAGIETPDPNSMAGRVGGPKEVNGKPAGQGFLTDDIGGNDKYNLLGREKVAGADTFGSMGEAIDAGLRQIDDGMADFRGRMRGGLASYVENADKFQQYAYQSAMEEPYGIRETAAHKLALGYYGKSTGDPATEITIDKDGNLWRWIPNEGTDEQGRPLAPARFMTPRSEVQKMLDETGNGRKWDAFTKRYLSKDAWETSRTAWVLDRGEGYFTGMASKEIRADYNSWKAEKQSLARQGRLDAMAADEAAQKKALNEARINEANARAEHYRNTGAGGTGASGNQFADGGYDIKMAAELRARANDSEAVLRQYVEAHPELGDANGNVFASAKTNDPQFLLLQNAAMRDRLSAIQYGYGNPGGTGADGGEATSDNSSAAASILAPSADERATQSTQAPAKETAGSAAQQSHGEDKLSAKRDRIMGRDYWKRHEAEVSHRKDRLKEASAKERLRSTGRSESVGTITEAEAIKARQAELDEYMSSPVAKNAIAVHDAEVAAENAYKAYMSKKGKAKTAPSEEARLKGEYESAVERYENLLDRLDAQKLGYMGH